MTTWNQGKPLGINPLKAFSDQDNPYYTLRLGTISRVDSVAMKADVTLLTGGPTKRFEVSLTQGLAGPRSFLGGVPEEGSLVVCGFRRQHKNAFDLHILGYLSVGNITGGRFDPFAITDPSTLSPEDKAVYDKVYSTTRMKRLFLRPGDIGAMSSSGAEMTLSADLRMVNRAGDLLELRDAERSLVTQSLHRVGSTGASYSFEGPIRRSAYLLPLEITGEDGVTLTSTYEGKDVLEGRGAGPSGSIYRYSSNGKLASFLVAPSVTTLPNHRRVSYTTRNAGEVPDDPEGSGLAFTEKRCEIRHTSDLSLDTLDEVHGFAMTRPASYIQQVYGTVVGNDPDSTQGQRVYGKVLRPRLFPDFLSHTRGDWALEEVDRTGSDQEVMTIAGAMLTTLQPPMGKIRNPYAYAVNKQGKVYLNVPKPQVDKDNPGVSAEVNLDGALKAYIGSASPTNTSLHLTLEGGVKADIGHNTEDGQGGNAIDVTYHSAVTQMYRGTGTDDNLALSTDVQGNARFTSTGEVQGTLGSSLLLNVSGMLQAGADRVNVNAHSGYSGNYGELNLLVAGKSQYNYALAVLETIVAGGRQTTVLAGGMSETIVAGAKSFSVLGGAFLTNVAAGAYAVTVGTGAVTLSTGAGTVSVTAGAGAMTLTSGLVLALNAGLAMTLTAATLIALTAPQVLLGAPVAPLGVCRGVPALPPGVPTLDLITGLPLPGSLTVRSILSVCLGFPANLQQALPDFFVRQVGLSTHLL